MFGGCGGHAGGVCQQQPPRFALSSLPRAPRPGAASSGPDAFFRITQGRFSAWVSLHDVWAAMFSSKGAKLSFLAHLCTM